MNSESRGRLLVWHLSWTCLCIFTIIYDNWAFKQSGGKGYEDCLTYGGPWKVLTYWNMVGISEKIRPWLINMSRAKIYCSQEGLQK